MHRVILGMCLPLSVLLKINGLVLMTSYIWANRERVIGTISRMDSRWMCQRGERGSAEGQERERQMREEGEKKGE